MPRHGKIVLSQQRTLHRRLLVLIIVQKLIHEPIINLGIILTLLHLSLLLQVPLIKPTLAHAALGLLLSHPLQLPLLILGLSYDSIDLFHGELLLLLLTALWPPGAYEHARH